MFCRFIATVAAALALTACGTTTMVYKVSDPETVRVVEGTIVSAKVTQKAPPVTATSTAATAIAANNVGNSTVGAIALLVNVLDSAAEDTNLWQMHLVVLDDKTKSEEAILFERLIQGRDGAPAPGDKVRVIIRADNSKALLNLTKYPHLDEMTR
jgi:hypothetical protein